MSGKKLRLKRFQYPHSRQGLIVPIDHGLTVGPLGGLQSVRTISSWIAHSSICGVIAHKGMAERLIEADALSGAGLMIHLNGMSSLSSTSDTKERLTSLETAIRLGADGVSFQVNFDGRNDAENLTTMGSIVDEAAHFGLPVLAMVYDKAADTTNQVVRARHLLRIAVEMGCDAVKIAPPRSSVELLETLQDLSEDIHVFVAGGTLTTDAELFDLARTALRAGAAGLCVGRNVFQRSDVGETLSELQRILDPQPFQVVEAYGAH